MTFDWNCRRMCHDNPYQVEPLDHDMMDFGDNGDENAQELNAFHTTSNTDNNPIIRILKHDDEPLNIV